MAPNLSKDTSVDSCSINNTTDGASGITSAMGEENEESRGTGAVPDCPDTADLETSDIDEKPERRNSSEVRKELKAGNLSNSTNTVDSWGGNDVNPLPQDSKGPADDEVSELDDEDDSKISEVDQVANYINFDKLLTPGSSEYYYTPANKQNRRTIEKAGSTVGLVPKNSKAEKVIDESGHTRHSMLSVRSSASAYRGPEPRMKNGRRIKSALKRSSSTGVPGRGGSDFDASRKSISSAPVGVQGSESESEGGSKGKELRRCTFSSIDIREHERIAGDNPCVSSGVPLSIGWGFVQHDPIEFDFYQTHKAPGRSKIEMMVPAEVRKQMLRDEFQVPVKELNDSMKEVTITKRQRRQTNASEHLEGWQEVSQSVNRKFKRFLKKTTTSQEAEKLWIAAEKKALKEMNSQGITREEEDIPPSEISITTS
mmetsp:Transcript_15751/g.36288  ORF Transcript_15751/g.36288 Transcript_15751/m.36288 type:complete len:427 (+) Transcript_15751:461-1741(+)